VQKEWSKTKSNNAQHIEIESSGDRITIIVFIVTYIIFLAGLVISPTSATSGLYINWENLTAIQALNLTAAIAFSFFLPGYALVTVLSKKYKLRPLLKLLLAYLFSILFTGFGGYVSGSFGYQISNNTIFFIGAYILIFLFYLQQVNAFRRGFYHTAPYLFHQSLSKIWKLLLNNYSQFIVFSSLFALVILYTYYLNDGKIVVDQWYHHGRALLIGSGLFKDLGPSDVFYAPFFSSLLAAFFNLSGSPSVNAYIAISFLNIVPVFAFYYFFTNWVPKDKQRAALLASTLFMLSSGFGWLYAINAAVDSHYRLTYDISSTLDIVDQTYRKTFDIETPTTFIDVGHPDVTTPLIVIALPAGFTLLGMTKETKLFNIQNGDDITSARLRTKNFRMLTGIAIVTAISFLGILSHEEFFLFIIVASSAMVILFRQLPKNVNYSIFFVSFLGAISLVILVDMFISPAKFYTFIHILGVPLIILCFLFVSLSWTLYATFRKIKFSNIHHIYKIKKQINMIEQQSVLKRIITLRFLNENQIRFVKLLLGMVIVAFVAYFYLFTVLVWNSLSVDDISSQIKQFANVPWYLYPIKFGLTGLLGLAFILSYLFKKFEKEIFIFGIIIIIALLAGPYYDEHRFGKYIMAGMAAFAALLIYQIISSGRIRVNLKVRPLIVSVLLGIVVTSSSLSIFMYAGWVELFTGKSDLIEGGRRDFPTTSEIRLLNFLNNKIIDSKAYNIALPEKETSNERGFVTKIYGFTPTSRVKLLQSPLTLNASTLEGLYNLLDYADVRYIILPKKDITSLSNHSYNGNITNVMRFVLDNFPKAYEDHDYIILEVLPLTSPSLDNSSVAFVYQRGGINTYYSKSEFQPIILDHIPNVTDHSYPQYQKLYYQDYYPLNMLALSKIKYDAYIDRDLSAFSNKYVVLPFDKVPYQKNEAIKYLEYVNNGGNLIVINSDNKFDGIFGKLLSIKPGNLTKFTSIGTYNSSDTGEKKYSLNISGIARNLEFISSDNLVVKSYYVNKDNRNGDQNAAPFVIEKSYGNGKIIFVNAIGYFDAILEKSVSTKRGISNENPYFVTLSKIAPMIGIPNDTRYVEKNSHPITFSKLAGIIGDLKIFSRQTIVINSSYLLLPGSGGDANPRYNLTAKDVSVSITPHQKVSLTNLTNHSLFNKMITTNSTGSNFNSMVEGTGNGGNYSNYNFANVIMRNLRLYGGPFQLVITVYNSTVPVYLPTSSSYNDYIAMAIPKSFDMAIKFSGNNSTYVQLDMIKMNEENSLQRIKVSGYNSGSYDGNNSTGQILFQNVRTDNQTIKYITALLKSAEIKLRNEDNRNDVSEPSDEGTRVLGFKKNSLDITPMEIQKGTGDITMNIDHVDNYNEHYQNWTRTKFITYLKNDIQITNDGKKIIPQGSHPILTAKFMLKLPGDISETAKENGIGIPWHDVLNSRPSNIISLFLVAIVVLLMALTWLKVRKLNGVM
jgi:hypothetical protein